MLLQVASLMRPHQSHHPHHPHLPHHHHLITLFGICHPTLHPLLHSTGTFSIMLPIESSNHLWRQLSAVERVKMRRRLTVAETSPTSAPIRRFVLLFLFSVSIMRHFGLKLFNRTNSLSHYPHDFFFSAIALTICQSVIASSPSDFFSETFFALNANHCSPTSFFFFFRQAFSAAAAAASAFITPVCTRRRQIFT